MIILAEFDLLESFDVWFLIKPSSDDLLWFFFFFLLSCKVFYLQSPYLLISPKSKDGL